MLKIRVNNQIASKFNDRQIVSDAVNFISIQFEFDSSWDGLDKTYQFSNGEIDIDVISNESIIQIPHEVLIHGKLSVKVRGVKLSDDGVSLETKATSNPVYYNILDSELVVADNSTPIEPEIKEQIRQLAEKANVLATTTYDKIVEVEDEIYIIVQIKNNMIELKSQVSGLVDDANLTHDNIKGLQEDINTSISNFITEEDARVVAESLRNTAETQRGSAFNEIVQDAEVAINNTNEAANKANLAKENI